MLDLIAWLQHHWIVPLFAIFLLIVITTYWPSRKSRMERNARIPLEDDR